MQTDLLPKNWKSVLLVVFAALGMLGFLGRATFLFVQGAMNFSASSPGASSDLAGNVLDALSMVYCALLLIPMLVYSLRALRGGTVRPITVPSIRFGQAAVLGAVWLLIAVGGSLLSSLFAYGWVGLAVFFPLGVALPILFLVWIGVGGLPTTSARRMWVVFGLAMAGSTVLALLAEYLVVGAGALVGLGALFLHPEWRPVFQQLKTQVTQASDMQAMLTVLAPYLTNPFVVFALLVFASGIGPLIEEAAKPAAIWLVGKQLRSPSEGFALGILCGAGFALLEGVTAASGYSQIWGVGMAGRAVSSLMHITASGLVGWGIASARLEKRYLRLAGAYLGAVCLHGLWNGAVVLAVVGAARWTVAQGPSDMLAIILISAGVGLLLVILPVILVALPVANHLLRPGLADPQTSTPEIDV